MGRTIETHTANTLHWREERSLVGSLFCSPSSSGLSWTRRCHLPEDPYPGCGRGETATQHGPPQRKMRKHWGCAEIKVCDGKAVAWAALVQISFNMFYFKSLLVENTNMETLD